MAFTVASAQAAPKIVSFSICAGKDCENNASQHNFTHPGQVKIPTGLPAGFKITSITQSCAAFCSHAALWPEIVLQKGHDASYVTLDARHAGSINASSTARNTVYTLNIWLHY
jgi:hypothetical protein